MPNPVYVACCLIFTALSTTRLVAFDEEFLSLEEIGETPTSMTATTDNGSELTWWLPQDADALVVPITGGVLVEKSRPELLRWLRNGSPWRLTDLPAIGARYGEKLLVVIVPWPQYANLIVEDRVGIRYSFPTGRQGVTPREIVVAHRPWDPLEVAHTFRNWRRTAKDIGVIPRSRSLKEKARQLPRVSRLYGAPHIYLWGPSVFSRHDVATKNWIKFAEALRKSPEGSIGRQIVAQFTESQLSGLNELAEAEWPMRHLVTEVAAGIQDGLCSSRIESSQEDREAFISAFANQFSDIVHPPHSWGDGMSLTMLEALRDAGLSRAVLLLSNLYGGSPRPDVAKRAAEYGYLLGPYDSYHSVHSPAANPDQTWETAQFDAQAYEQGRVLNRDGSGHGGFRGRGFHFSPRAAWPYVESRVKTLHRRAGYSVWFVDCDATAECFDDYNPRHPATRADDLQARRRRLSWLESQRGLVVGSEGGSVLFSGTIHFGHGVHTPYIGHLAPEFRQPTSQYFLGKHWPPDTPGQSFRPVPVPPSLRSPYFDPTARIPLYQAAVGDEVIVSHHWSFDSLKFSDIAATRELLEILYMVPPMYHLNRETWPNRRETILKHVNFWGKLHREVAEAPLVQFTCLTNDRLVQRTTFRRPQGDVILTANFSDKAFGDIPPMSVHAAGHTELAEQIYRVGK